MSFWPCVNPFITAFQRLPLIAQPHAQPLIAPTRIKPELGRNHYLIAHRRERGPDHPSLMNGP